MNYKLAMVEECIEFCIMGYGWRVSVHEMGLEF